MGELYHQNVVQLLEMSDKVRRKMSYLTLGAAAPLSALNAKRPAGDRGLAMGRNENKLVLRQLP